MDILGVGPLEIVVILVIALLVFGPEKLPEIGAKLGQAVRELRNLSREITREVDTAREAVAGPVEELSKPFKEANQVVQDLSQAAGAVRNPAQTLEKALVGQLAPARPPVPEPDTTSSPDAAAQRAAPPVPDAAPAVEGLPSAAPPAPAAPAPAADAAPTPANSASLPATDRDWEI